jgi:hypothetical protein
MSSSFNQKGLRFDHFLKNKNFMNKIDEEKIVSWQLFQVWCSQEKVSPLRRKQKW